MIVDELGGFVAESGGKRVRPTLHLLCARLCGYQGNKDIILATVLEFIHCATLIHDDIIDGATTRRGRPSANRNWGNNVSVLFGDYLFAKAMEMALEAESLQIMERLAEVTLRMTEGEMLQTRYAGRIDLTEAEYLDLIERKTAAHLLPALRDAHVTPHQLSEVIVGERLRQHLIGLTREVLGCRDDCNYVMGYA